MGAFSRRAILGQVIGLAWPVLIENVLGTAVGLVSTYIVGHLGATALAAVGLSNQLSFVLMALFGAVGVGSTALIARHAGARELAEANYIAGQSLTLAVVTGALAGLPCLLWGRALLTVMGGSADVVAQGQPYLFAGGTTMPLMAVLFIGNAALRGVGNTRTPMVVMGLVNLLNAALSWLLARGAGPLPALGVLGAGIGSAASVGIGGLIVAVLLLRSASDVGLRVTLAMLRPDLPRMRRLLRIGLPGGAEQALLRLAQLLSVTLVAQLGTDAYAGHQLGIQLLSISYTPGFAFSVAATTLVGQALGQGKPDLAEACVHMSNLLALSVMGGAGVIAFLWAEPILRIFTMQSAVIAQGIYAVRGGALFQLPLALSFVLSGALRGAGDTRFVLFSQTAPLWVVRVPLVYRFGITWGWGLSGVWAGFILDGTARALLLVLRFRQGRWKWLKI